MAVATRDPAAAPPTAPAPDRADGSPSATALAAVAVCLLLVLGLSVLVAVGIGSASIAPGSTASYLWRAVTGGTIAADDASEYQIVWQIRTPRVLLAAVVGAGLSAVGVAVQALVRNPLADPFVLGVSSGAAVGAVTVGLVGGLGALGIYAVSAGAFAAALGASVLVYAAARSRAGVLPLRLVLTGVALSFGFQALLAVVVYLTPSAESASTLLFWSVGSFGAASWGALPLVAGTVLVGIVLLRRGARRLDVLTLGDETATSLGVDPRVLRRRLFAVTAVMTGAMVAVSGAIGFVGLVVPHVVRLVLGAVHARVLLVAPLLGAILMVWVDVASRTVAAPRELPLGAITALVGVPVFLLLMRRRAYVFGG